MKFLYLIWIIIAHGIAFGAHLGIGALYAATSIVIPGYGLILAGVGALIHSSIFGINYFFKKKEQLENLINRFCNYSVSFNDHLKTFSSDINQTLKNLKDSIIDQINDKYLIKNLLFDENEEKKFKEIMQLFQKNIEENFNLE